MDIIRITDLKKYYQSEEETIKAVDGMDFVIAKGEFISITGVSGSGKSSLLNLIGGLDQPTAGKIIVNGEDITKLTEEKLTIFRRRNIGFVFQDYNLIPILNVYENIVLPIELDGEEIDPEYINDLIKCLGLTEKINKMPNQLSGGQQQRVAIARALATKPSIVLADEPTGNLDSKTSQDVMGLFKSMNQQFKQTILMITHNEEIAQMADDVIHIIDGKIRRDEETNL